MYYLKEWAASCVDDQLTRLNVTVLEGDRPYDYLLYADDLPRRNDGRIRDSILKRYQHLEEGGWWCSGIDVLTGDEDLWGCFKPMSPRYAPQKQKPIKYEHPPKTNTGIFALRVPLHLWQRIAQRYKVCILPEDLDPQQPDLGFWQWLITHREIPLCITEGAKKAGALLTAGFAAIALPGIYGGYRVPRDEQGNIIGKARLIPQLEKFAQEKRPIYMVFDQDQKPKTIKAVNAAIRQTGYLLTRQDCEVRVVQWQPQQGKGVDDLIAAQGVKAFETAYGQALTLDTWKAHSLGQLTYRATHDLNTRYLPPLEIPSEARLIGLKSPKGTGKTQFLTQVVQNALNRHQWVLVIGHRVRLVEALCQRFGLKYITEVQDNPTGQALGYGLCIDSLHPNSQAKFKAGDWSNGVVIIDEVEQVLWHGLNSTTCQNQRVAILKSLKTLLENTLGGQGQVYVADADLSDVSLDYLLKLAGVRVQPWVIENHWQPTREEAWPLHHYTETTPDHLLQDLVQHIAEGGKPFVCLSAQKLQSQWGTCNLEAYLSSQFPTARILRLDSESLADPTHAAYGCMANLDERLKQYDIVLASPVIETGVSIELRGHFTSVWAIAQGIQSENSVRQALGRIRENLPRWLWVAPYGFNQVGNGSTSIPALLDSGQRLTQVNIRLLQQSDFEALDDLETGFGAESLLCWAKFAVRLNAAMLNYRDMVLTGLLREGHYEVTPPAEEVNLESPSEAGAPSPFSLSDAIAQVRDHNYHLECNAIAQSRDLTETTYQQLKKQLIKTPSQRRTVRKYELQQRYGITISPQIVIRDDGGWYSQLRLHYFLTFGRPYLSERDCFIAKQLMEQGEGAIFPPDFNRSQLGAAIGTLERLGIPTLLAHPERELSNTDTDLQAIQHLALSHRSFIKTVLGIGLAKNSTPIVIVRRLLEQIGYRVQCIKYKKDPHQPRKRIRVYQLVNPDDDRFEVFEYWLSQDKEIWRSLDDYPTIIRPVSETNWHSPYLQLSLF
ncbi:plasmid replication protein, CyRepA1 family [Spirulina subsalsa]|uniref:plasmid replication protein, CyRepA1 family n=1 Tax=Spirulina subsalsa TaxID=54311 RepID=UPI0002E00E0B|nr:plasmid replication protein, CyRepA1 family [Spirulina subsalsa]